MNKTVSLETAKLLVEKGIDLSKETKYGYAELCAVKIELIEIKDIKDYIFWQNHKVTNLFAAPDIPELLAELSNKDILDYVNQQEFFDQTMGEYINLLRNPDRLAQALIWVRSKAEVK